MNKQNSAIYFGLLPVMMVLIIFAVFFSPPKAGTQLIEPVNKADDSSDPDKSSAIFDGNYLYIDESDIATTDCGYDFTISCPDERIEINVIGEYEVTAYCHCVKCCGKSDRMTASGYRLKDGDLCIAADLPFGTVLSVPGYGIATVLDRGGAIKGKRLDLYFDTHQKALNWGRKTLQIREIK